MITMSAKCSHRCELSEQYPDHVDCPNPEIVCGVEGCLNDREPGEEYCRQCDYEMGMESKYDV